MSQQELLTHAISILEDCDVPYFVTGSLASAFHGEPRSSHDIDLVVDLSPRFIDRLCSEFPAPRYYLSRIAIDDALRHRSMFNLTEIETGDKLDFWLHKGTPFDESRFARRELREFWGAMVWFQSAEDTILAKLDWARECGGSTKQMSDIRGILREQGSELDRHYVDFWASRLELVEFWREAGQSDA